MMKKARGTKSPITLRRFLPIVAVLLVAAFLIAPVTAADEEQPVASGFEGGVSWKYFTSNTTLVISPATNTDPTTNPDGLEAGYMRNYSYHKDSASPLPWKDYRTTLTTVKFEEGVKHIGAWNFYNFAALTSIDTLPDSLVSIGGSAFHADAKLEGTTVNLGQNAEMVYPHAFVGTKITGYSLNENNQYLKLVDGILFSKDGKTLINCPESKTGDFKNEWLNGVETISAGAFRQCKNFNPNTLTIPSSVTTIGDQAFQLCTWITGELTIPDSVTGNLANVFYGDTGITKVTLGTGITSIGSGAFSQCTGLKTMEWKGTVSSVGENAFNSCYSLEGFTLPTSVTSVGKQAFYQCKGLITGDLSHLTNIGTMAFGGKDSTLENGLTFGDVVISEDATVGARIFQGSTLTSLQFNAKTLPASALKDATITGTVTLGDGVEYIGIGNIAERTVSATLSGVKETETNAFYKTTFLTDISIPAGAVIHGSSLNDNGEPSGASVFLSATLKNVTYNAEIMPYYTFFEAHVDSIKLGSNVKTLQKRALSHVYNTIMDLTEMNPEITIGDDAFASPQGDSVSIIYVKDSESLAKITGKLGTSNKPAVAVTNGGTFTGYDAYTTGGALATPERAGYTFVEWNDESGNVVTTAEKGKTYYAKWLLNTPTVTVTADKTGIVSGESVTLTAEISPALPTDVTPVYQWYADGVEITDANSLTYTNESQTATTVYTFKVTADAGDSGKIDVTSEPVTVTWSKKAGNVVITNSKTTAIYSDEPFTFTYTASGDTSVDSSNKNVATVSDKDGTVTVTIVGVGETTISVNFAGNDEITPSSDSFKLTVSADEGVMTITPDFASLVGGGKVNLTVKGVPEGEQFSVTCDDADVAAKLVKNVDGTYTAELPNADKTYKFTAKYVGSANYQIPDATCPVKVTAVKVVGDVIGLPTDRDLGLGAVETEDKETLTAAIGGEHKDAFTGKGTPVFVEVSVLKADGKPDHSVKITFTLAYSTLGVAADKAGTYDFVVLHLMENGKTVLVPAVATADGLQIGPTTTSPFAIAYSVKKDDTNNGGSSTPQGSSVWLQEPLTPTPTETAQPTPTDVVPTDIPTTQPTPTQTETPGFGVLAVLGGLGAVAVLRRK